MELEVPALPREVWHLVLSYLPHRHLARAILVCQDWAQAAGDPHLWKDFSLRLASEDSLGLGERLARLLNLHRFSYLRQLELAHVAASPVPLASTLSLSTHHIHLIASSSITSLRLDNCDLSDCNEESLAALLNNLNALDLDLLGDHFHAKMVESKGSTAGAGRCCRQEAELLVCATKQFNRKPQNTYNHTLVV